MESVVNPAAVVYNIIGEGVHSMSQVISLRVPDEMAKRLDRFASRQGTGMNRTKTSMMLLEESLREAEFAGIEYRDSEIGRQPFIKGTGLTVWEMIAIARAFDYDAERVAEGYEYPVGIVTAGLNYYSVYREEVDRAIEDNHISYEDMKRDLPNIELYIIPRSVTDEVETLDAVPAS